MKATIWFNGKVDASGGSMEECEANAATDLDWMGVWDVEITQTEITDHED
jgi:hypothetical protein